MKTRIPKTPTSIIAPPHKTDTEKKKGGFDAKSQNNQRGKK